MCDSRAPLDGAGSEQQAESSTRAHQEGDTWSTPVVMGGTAVVQLVKGEMRVVEIKYVTLECPFDGPIWEPPLSEDEDDDNRIHDALHDEYDIEITITREGDANGN